MAAPRKYELAEIDKMTFDRLRALARRLEVAGADQVSESELRAAVAQKLKELGRLEESEAEESDDDGTITVSYVPYDEELKGMVGKTIRQVVDELSEMFSIDTGRELKFFVNGNEEDDDYELEADDRLEIARRTGEKG